MLFAMKIEADKRSMTAQREPAAEQDARDARDGLADLREVQLRLAKAFARIDASAHFVFSGCASLVEYAVQQGYSAFEARTLLGLGKTLEAAPDAEARVRSGELTVEAGSAIGRILARPELVAGPAGSDQEGWSARDWLDAAGTDPFRKLKGRIKEQLEAHAQEDAGVESVTVVVTSKTKDAFQRACEVARQKARQSLSEGQVFHRVVDFYLDANDPLRAKEGTRRLGDTNDRPGDPQDPSTRYIPAEVKHAIWKRSGGTCEVPGCHHRHGLEFAHRVPHAKGSAREVCDLGLLCHRHHLLYDAGRIAWPIALEPPEGVDALGGDPPGDGSAGDGSAGDGSAGDGSAGNDSPGSGSAGNDSPGSDSPGSDSPGEDPPCGRGELGRAGGGDAEVREPRLQLLTG